ncbi:MAG: WD40 repeat domain-containing protein [Planctomycetaceae bacterium]|nr:WD40 repeat domain-containing protein [Planctomycetaceae bacterium]
MKAFGVLFLLGLVAGPEPVAGHPAGVMKVAFSPDGSLLAAGGSASVITVWDVASREVLHTLSGSGHEGALDFNPDGKLLCSGSSDATVRLWSMDKGSLVATFDAAPPKIPLGYVYAVAFSPDGSLIASGGAKDSIIRLWNVVQARHERPIGTYGSTIFCLGFSRDGAFLFAGSEDGKLRAINLGSGLSVFDTPAHAGGVRTLAVGPDGKTLLTGGVDKVARLWEFGDNKLIERRTFRGHTDMILGAAFLDGGKFVATASPDGTVRSWDTTLGTAAKTLWRGKGGARSVACGPRGRLAVGLWTNGTTEPNVLLGSERVATQDHD